MPRTQTRAFCYPSFLKMQKFKPAGSKPRLFGKREQGLVRIATQNAPFHHFCQLCSFTSWKTLPLSCSFQTTDSVLQIRFKRLACVITLLRHSNVVSAAQTPQSFMVTLGGRFWCTVKLLEKIILTRVGAEAPTVYIVGTAVLANKRWHVIPALTIPKLVKHSAEKCLSQSRELEQMPPSSKCRNSSHFCRNQFVVGKQNKARALGQPNTHLRPIVSDWLTWKENIKWEGLSRSRAYSIGQKIV